MTKKINILCSIYLTLAGIINVFNIITILAKNDTANLLVLFSITVLCLGIVITIVNNFFILKQINNIKKGNLLANLILCLFQVFNISVNGFQFKYNQGIETNIYAEIGNTIGNFKIGAYTTNFNLSLRIDFLTLDYNRLEINVLALFLVIFYWIQYNKKIPL